MKLFSTGLAVFIFLAVIVSGCKEKGPLISFKDDKPLLDTTYIDNNLPVKDHRKVFIEEFTGVHCTNCPLGHETIQDILTNSPDSVVAVSMHNSNTLAEPFAGEEDFRIEEGIKISDKLGGTGAIPSASIDRNVFPGNILPAVFRPSWPGLTKQRLSVPSPVNIDITNVFDDVTRNLLTNVKLHYTRNVDSLNHLSIMITESGVISPQKMPDLSTNSTYVHNHLLRGMVTSTFGVKTHDTTEAGRVIERQYVFNIPAGWDADHCEVVAFVHFIGTTDEVLQAEIEPVK